MRKSPHTIPQEPKEAMKEKYQQQAETISQVIVSQICNQFAEILNGKTSASGSDYSERRN